MAAPKKSATKEETGSKKGGTSAKKSTSETSAKKSATSAKKSAGGSKGGAVQEGSAKTQRGTQGGLARAVTPDQDLAKVVGGDPLTRAALTQKIWDYIRSNKLQDEKDRRMINADKNLKTIFGGKDQVSMFEMTKLVNQHVS